VTATETNRLAVAASQLRQSITEMRASVPNSSRVSAAFWKSYRAQLDIVESVAEELETPQVHTVTELSSEQIVALHRIQELREFAHRGAKAVAVDVELLDAVLRGAKT
jgi:hypothetical protein